MLPEGVDAFFITNPYDILYITGFKTLSPHEREAFVLITKKNTYLITDGRHDTINFQFSIPNFQVRLISQKNPLKACIRQIIKDEEISRFGFQEEDLKFMEFQNLRKILKRTKLIPVKNHISRIREIKKEKEILKIKKACEVADKCLFEIAKTIKQGQSEKEIAFRIETWFKNKGYDMSFYPIVAVDENAAIPHYDTRFNGKKKVSKNSLILIDYGVTVDDYCSDITRVIFLGKPNNEILRAYSDLLEAQEETIKYISRHCHPEPTRHPELVSGSNKKMPKQVRHDGRLQLKDVDLFCRKLLKKKGLPDFPYSTGHGIGLEVHEAPRISRKSKEILKENQVFTIEPGVYMQGRWGLRIEDIVRIKKDSVEVLTKFPKKPYII